MCCPVFSPQTRGLQDEMKSRLPNVTTAAKDFHINAPESNNIINYSCSYGSYERKKFVKVSCQTGFIGFKHTKADFLWSDKTLEKQSVNLGNSTGFFCSRTGSTAQLGFAKAVLSHNVDASIINTNSVPLSVR